MGTWQQWLAMAIESQNAAVAAEASRFYRSSVSRYYYAAYQATSAVLIYRGLTPPPEEEAWGHAATPDMLVEHYVTYVRSRDVRQRYAKQLRELYRYRIRADYRGSERLDTEISQARMYAGRLVRLAVDVLPGS